MDNVPAATRAAILDAIASNRKLMAIKLYKDATGSDLITAKNVIEAHISRTYEEGPNRFTGEFAGVDATEAELILDEIFTQRKLDAVKRYKNATGRSLIEAKHFVEDLTERLKKECPDQFQANDGVGCGSVLFAMIAIVSLLGSLLCL